MDKNFRDFVLENLRTLSSSACPIYLVGGAVRDQLLGHEGHDLDFVMPGETLPFAREAARRLNGALYVLDEERNAVRVVLEQEQTGGKIYLDFASLRMPDITGDLRSRDFTINAMAYDINHPERLVDPLGGINDLRDKRIRVCAPESLVNDPVRVLRAVRQAIKFGFAIDSDTFSLMRGSARQLVGVSVERVRDELFRILDDTQISLALRILDRCGALGVVLPEIVAMKGMSQSAPHVSDAWEHTLSVITTLEQLLSSLVGYYREEKVSDLTIGSAVLWLGRHRNAFQTHFLQKYVADRGVRSLLFFAALYHDVAKPQTREETSSGKVRFWGHDCLGSRVGMDRARQLALSTHEIDRIGVIIQHHMRVHHLANSTQVIAGDEVSRRSIYRYFRDTGISGVDIVLLSLADVRGTYGVTLTQQVWETELRVGRTLLDAYWEKTEEIVSPPRLITGHEIMQSFQLSPGKLIGTLLDVVQEGQAVGEITSREDALAFIQEFLEKPGSSTYTDGADDG